MHKAAVETDNINHVLLLWRYHVVVGDCDLLTLSCHVWIYNLWRLQPEVTAYDDFSKVNIRVCVC